MNRSFLTLYYVDSMSNEHNERNACGREGEFKALRVHVALSIMKVRERRRRTGRREEGEGNIG